MAPRLFNQIDCDDKYKPAFFFAVNSAYVADTMDAAAALYKQVLLISWVIHFRNNRTTIYFLKSNQLSDHNISTFGDYKYPFRLWISVVDHYVFPRLVM